MPEPAALAAAVATPGDDAPPALPPFPECSPPWPCHLGASSPLSCAVRADLDAARSAEQEQEHRPWVNHRLLEAPGGVDVVALAIIIISCDATLLEDRAQHT